MIPVAVDPIMQKDARDCGVAALAMILGRPYLEVSEAALGLGLKPHDRGLYDTEIVKLARALGVNVCRRAANLGLPFADDETGVLTLRRRGAGHVVALFQGVVVNPADGLLWDLSTFLERGKWKIAALIEVLEG